MAGIRQHIRSKATAHDRKAVFDAGGRRMQQALRASRSFTFDWNPRTDRVERSDSCASILGLRGEDAVADTGKHYFQCIHPDDRDRFVQMLSNLTPAAADYATEYRVVRPDGSEVVLEEIGQAEFDAGGSLVGLFGVSTNITARKRAEEALRQAAADLQTANAALAESRRAALNLMDDAIMAKEQAVWLARFPDENPNPVMRISLDGKVLYRNAAAAEDPGWTSGGGRGITPPLRELVDRAIAHRTPLEQDLELGDKAFLVSVALFPEEGYANLYGRDITAQKRAEALEREALALALASQTAMDILESMGEGVVLLGMDGKIKSINPAMERMTGISAEEGVGLHASDLIPEVLIPQQQPLAMEALSTARSGQVPETPPLTLLSRTGKQLHVITSVSFVRDMDNQPREIVVTLHDISSLVQARQELVASERRYRELVENANSIIMRVTLEHDITFFNEYAQAFFGYTEAEVLGRNVVGTITPAVDSEGRDLRALLRDISAHPERHGSNENECICKDGRRVWVHWANKAVRDQDGNVTELLCVGTDGTERRRMQAQAARYQRRLRELAKRLATAEEQDRWRISRYIHDSIIQNLSLSHIRLGSMARPLANAQLGEEAKKLDQIRSQLDEAIDECRMVMSDLTPALLYELGLFPALKGFARQLAEKHGVRVTIADDGPELSLAPELRGLLFESVRELIMNAIKHAGPCEIRVDSRCRDGMLELRVTDDGRGFDLSSERIAADNHGGFGTFSIRQRVEGLGGDLEIASEPGKGTTATITVPVA